MIPAHVKAINAQSERIDPDDLPSDEEQSAFNKEVVIPAFFDAVRLSRTACAETIVADLGDVEQFFEDIQIAKLGATGDFNKLRTSGVREWADLQAINKSIMKEIV